VRNRNSVDGRGESATLNSDWVVAASGCQRCKHARSQEFEKNNLPRQKSIGKQTRQQWWRWWRWHTRITLARSGTGHAPMACHRYFGATASIVEKSPLSSALSSDFSSDWVPVGTTAIGVLQRGSARNEKRSEGIDSVGGVCCLTLSHSSNSLIAF
jgi:hypothetical protein